jgi:hypothetical protein
MVRIHFVNGAKPLLTRIGSFYSHASLPYRSCTYCNNHPSSHLASRGSSFFQRRRQNVFRIFGSSFYLDLLLVLLSRQAIIRTIALWSLYEPWRQAITSTSIGSYDIPTRLRNDIRSFTRPVGSSTHFCASSRARAAGSVPECIEQIVWRFFLLIYICFRVGGRIWGFGLYYNDCHFLVLHRVDFK